jgi:hypothetical protein
VAENASAISERTSDYVSSLSDQAADWGRNVADEATRMIRLIQDTVASDCSGGVSLSPPFGITFKATLNRFTANNNQTGVFAQGNADTMIANSVISNNSSAGLFTIGNGVTSLAKTVISGNQTGVSIGSGIVKSYGDNYINDNTTPVMGSLTPVGMQ